MHQRQTFQTISWFNDLFNRELLNLDPPYQRRSVWPQSFKDYFIDTLLLNYPSPTIFLFEDIDRDGIIEYSVVDGKQRLTTVLDFIQNKFSISDLATRTELRGKYFEELSEDIRREFWTHSFSVEYLHTKELSVINNIFDRINRNVAKLTSQELRHAQLSGDFITSAETLAMWIFKNREYNFPAIAKLSKSQMKDVELVSQILLRFESKPKGYSTSELDYEFSERDDYWENKEDIIDDFKKIFNKIYHLLKKDTIGILYKSRLKNQVDFYSLMGAIYKLLQNDRLPREKDIINNLIKFVIYEVTEDSQENLKKYYDHVRVATNRTTARVEREKILIDIILGKYSLQ